MSIEPGNTYQFTVKIVPNRVASRKTIQRLMRMQPDVQRILSKLPMQRKNKDNVLYVRAGRPWVNRAKTTKVTRVAEGETFTLQVSPHIINDLQSVEKYLDVKAA